MTVKAVCACIAQTQTQNDRTLRSQQQQQRTCEVVWCLCGDFSVIAAVDGVSAG